MSPSAKQVRLQDLRSTVTEIEPRKAHELQQQGAFLIDVRESGETAAGIPSGAVPISRSFLEFKIESVVGNPEDAVLLICQAGERSLFAAESLRQMGYKNVCSVLGGFNAWKDQGLPFEIPRSLSSQSRKRYSRQLLLDEIGEAGQLKLSDSRVLLIGVGGLGSPAALYLAAAGVGTLGVVDGDVVDLSNLHRQVLHKENDLGTPKVESAVRALKALNPEVNVVSYRQRLDSANAETIFRDYQAVIDGSDNLSTRYLVNDICVKLGIPNIHGAIHRFDGQVSVFWPGHPGGETPCYRCFYPQRPPQELAPSCAEAGVLGTLPGVVGILQATETIKLLLGFGTPLLGRLLHYDALGGRFTEYEIRRDPHCSCCGTGASHREDEEPDEPYSCCAASACGATPNLRPAELVIGGAR
jgi:molybdopterin/thiamine biosynthesis adenylyltransferase/rhodanese-related sulfurtransferase